MPLAFREPTAADHDRIVDMVVRSFAPITWYRKLDARMEPLNGHDWKERFEDRVRAALARQYVIVGESDGRLATYASGDYDPKTRSAFLDLLAVDDDAQRGGLGRQTLREFERRMAEKGALYLHLECLTDNDAGNGLYESEGFFEIARHFHWYKKI
ncbi:MAG: GNAT family N-acetyltransferase [Bryobacterales bacterium]|nr:GNAT family N-acetyltransferase [Acidobacteriota bacterium]MCB9383844.1 GNAT family N-acetyltransferase [Bryobacterales bacterium]